MTPKAGDIAGAIAKIKAAQPDVILNTIVGHTNVAVLRELRLAGIQPTTIPTAWFAVSESELNQFPIDGLAGDYSVACYFGSLQRPQNKEFLERFRKHYGDNEPVNDDMQTAYASVYLWRDAVEKAGTTETSKVRKALRRAHRPGAGRADPNRSHDAVCRPYCVHRSDRHHQAAGIFSDCLELARAIAAATVSQLAQPRRVAYVPGRALRKVGPALGTTPVDTQNKIPNDQ